MYLSTARVRWISVLSVVASIKWSIVEVVKSGDVQIVKIPVRNGDTQQDGRDVLLLRQL